MTWPSAVLIFSGSVPVVLTWQVSSAMLVELFTEFGAGTLVKAS